MSKSTNVTVKTTKGGAGKGPGNAGKGGSANNANGPGSKNTGYATKSPRTAK